MLAIVHATTLAHSKNSPNPALQAGFSFSLPSSNKKSVPMDALWKGKQLEL